MRSSSGRRQFGVSRLWPLGVALAVSLAGCQGESQESSSQPPETPPAAVGEGADAGKSPMAAEGSQASKAKVIDSPEAHAELANELAASRTQAQTKREPVDPELEKRMKDPEYRKQKDAMLSKLSQVSTTYFQEGIEIRHTRKRPEWRLIDPTLSSVTDPAERRKKGEVLAKRFKAEVEPVLDRTIDVIVFADASESIQVY